MQHLQREHHSLGDTNFVAHAIACQTHLLGCSYVFCVIVYRIHSFFVQMNDDALNFELIARTVTIAMLRLFFVCRLRCVLVLHCMMHQVQDIVHV